METLRNAWPYLRKALVHRATYTAIVAVLGAFGYAKAPEVAHVAQTVVEAIFGPLQ